MANGHPKCPSMDKMVKQDVVYPYKGLLCVHKKWVLTHVIIGMHFKDIMLSEISQFQKEKYHMITFLGVL